MKVFKGDCRTCGQKGHKSADCWENPQNKDKRAANWKSKNSPEAAHDITANSGLHCDYFHKTGHTEDRCFKKKREIVNPKKTIETASCVYESALNARAIEDGVLNENPLIADTGASSHMVYSKKYLTNLVPHDASITAGHDDLMKCTEKGTYRDYFKNALGKKIPVYLTNVFHVPSLNVNKFSITKCIKKPGIQFQGTHKVLVLLVKGVRIDFEKQLTYGTGNLYATDITPTVKQTEAAYAITEGAFAIKKL
jgi:hypothetical protein